MLEILSGGSSTRPSQTSNSPTQSTSAGVSPSTGEGTSAAENSQPVESEEENSSATAEPDEQDDGTYSRTPSVTDVEPQESDAQEPSENTALTETTPDKTPQQEPTPLHQSTARGGSAMLPGSFASLPEKPSAQTEGVPDFAASFRERMEEIADRYTSHVGEQKSDALEQRVQEQQSMAEILGRLGASVDSPSLSSMVVKPPHSALPVSLADQWYTLQ